METKTILIFPAGMPSSLIFLQQCAKEGFKTVGASSLAFDPARRFYDNWARLPYVTDPAFSESLQQLILRMDIGQIYTPNSIIWNYLNVQLRTIAPAVRLVNRSPLEEPLDGYRAALKKARFLKAHPLSFGVAPACHAMPTIFELAGLCRYAELVPGMCGEDKFHALCEISRHSMTGDIVEIGTWWGKSAFILAWLARYFSIGHLLCVDPWSNTELLQNEAMVDSGSAMLDADEALTIFQIGLLPFNHTQHINYLRMTSTEGASQYVNGDVVKTEIFGETRYTGNISILHIDGNHRYEAVKSDIEAWAPFVVDGGWIIFDDYLWPYGDGPKRVGDDFLVTYHSRISDSFVMGGALFIRL